MKLNLQFPLDVSTSEARDIQQKLADQVILEDDPRLARIRLVAGIDNAYAKTAARTTGFSVVVVMTWPELEIVEIGRAHKEITFPYVPGLLSFREFPVIIEALRGIASTPDLLICDGHGLAHPRRFGLACHVGVATGIPTIGSAKKPFVASYDPPDMTPGARSVLHIGAEPVGVALRTYSRRRLPIFISPGDRISIDTAADLAFAMTPKGLLPAPQQAAHDTVTRLRRDYLEGNPDAKRG